MKRWMTKTMGVALALTLLLCSMGALTAGAAANYTISSTALTVGKNEVTTEDAATTLYVFKPTTAGVFQVSVSGNAALSYWHGSQFYVSGVFEEAVGGILMLECTSAGQSFLIGLSRVTSATITIVEGSGYVPPSVIVYEPYINQHTPASGFTLPEGELTRVDVMKPQTVVADADGIYHLNSVNGPILYVNMCAATYADLYACYYPTTGSGALHLRARYQDETGNDCGYEFLEAMRPYADALDEDGYYYLTVDLAAFIQTYGVNQGWFRKDVSPFSLIKQGRFIEESAWLVNAYYIPATYTVGDTNDDGKVNNRDLGTLQQHLNGWTVPLRLDAADVDGNGKVNNRDLGTLQQQLNQ